MGPAFLVLLAVAFLVGAPLLLGALVVGAWMRRSQRVCALKTWIGAALTGTISFLAFFGAIASLIAIAVHEKRHPHYFDSHPFLPLLMIGLGFLALAAAFCCACFCAWTIWRLGAAPAAQPVRTTPAA